MSDSAHQSPRLENFAASDNESAPTQIPPSYIQPSQQADWTEPIALPLQSIPVQEQESETIPSSMHFQQSPVSLGYPL